MEASLQGKRRWKLFSWIISWDSFPMLAAVFTQRWLLSCQSFDIWDWFSTALSFWSLVRLSYSNAPQICYINIDLQYETLGDIINVHFSSYKPTSQVWVQTDQGRGAGRHWPLYLRLSCPNAPCPAPAHPHHRVCSCFIIAYDWFRVRFGEICLQSDYVVQSNYK